MVAAASLYSNAEDLAAYARYHVSTTHNRLLDSVFAEVRDTDIQRPDGVQGIASTTDFIGLEKITYQVGYIGGYSSFIGYDKERGNAVVVLQNTFNWSNYIGIALLMDMAKKTALLPLATVLRIIGCLSAFISNNGERPPSDSGLMCQILTSRPLKVDGTNMATSRLSQYKTHRFPD